MLGAFTVLPKNPSILEVLSAWHSQPPLDNFWLWLPLTRTTSVLLLICTERHTPMTKEISGFGRHTLKTKFMQVFTVLNSGVKVGEGGGMEWDNLGKKNLLLLPKLWHCFYQSFGWDIERSGKSFYYLHLSAFASLFLWKGLCLEHTTSEYSTQIFSSKIQIYLIQNHPRLEKKLLV